MTKCDFFCIKFCFAFWSTRVYCFSSPSFFSCSYIQLNRFFHSFLFANTIYFLLGMKKWCFKVKTKIKTCFFCRLSCLAQTTMLNGDQWMGECFCNNWSHLFWTNRCEMRHDFANKWDFSLINYIDLVRQSTLTLFIPLIERNGMEWCCMVWYGLGTSNEQKCSSSFSLYF